MLDLVPRRPRFEAAVVAFFFLVLTGYAVVLWWSWTAVAVDALRSGPTAVDDTGLAC